MTKEDASGEEREVTSEEAEKACMEVAEALLDRYKEMDTVEGLCVVVIVAHPEVGKYGGRAFVPYELDEPVSWAALGYSASRFQELLFRKAASSMARRSDKPS